MSGDIEHWQLLRETNTNIHRNRNRRLNVLCAK